METQDYYRIEKVIKYIEENFKTQPDLNAIAEEINLSPFHFQRLFKRWAGITPKKFLQFLTIEYIKDRLKDSESILDVTYESGLSSSSRLYDLFINIESITPTEYISYGKNLKIYYGFYTSIFGLCLIAVTDRGLSNLYFIEEDSKGEILLELKNEWINADIKEERGKTDPYYQQIFNNNNSRPINLFLKGTDFQIQVWKALLNIPKGDLTTYEKIGESIGKIKAFRAIGTAVGLNPISYLIPCHRVINKSGIIGKYRWGERRKKAMIGWEASKTH